MVQRKLVQLSSKPLQSSITYDACATIDRHNCCRKDDLGVDRKIEVKDRSKRVYFSLYSVSIVDAWLIYRRGRGAMNGMAQHFFQEILAEQLIDNTFDGKASTRDAETEVQLEVHLTSGRNWHLTPTKKRRTLLGNIANAVVQGRCVACSKFKSKFICYTCRDSHGKELYFCHSKTKRRCFVNHLSKKPFL